MAATDGANVAGGRVATTGSTGSLNGSASFGVGAGVSVMTSSVRGVGVSSIVLSVIAADVSGIISALGVGVCSIGTSTGASVSVMVDESKKGANVCELMGSSPTGAGVSASGAGAGTGAGSEGVPSVQGRHMKAVEDRPRLLKGEVRGRT